MISRIRIAFAVLALVASSVVYGQSNDFTLLEFKTASDYHDKENEILKMAEFILSGPLQKDENSKIASANVLKWMTGTPDYSFAIDASVSKVWEGNEDVLLIYLASSTKAAISLGNNDGNQIKLRAFELLLDYCNTSSNNITNTKELRKATDARKNGKLAKYLDIKS